MKKILFLCLFLGGCNSVNAIGSAFEVGNSIGINYDTNGYYTKKTQPPQKICEYKVGPNNWAWKPC